MATTKFQQYFALISSPDQSKNLDYHVASALSARIFESLMKGPASIDSPTAHNFGYLSIIFTMLLQSLNEMFLLLSGPSFLSFPCSTLCFLQDLNYFSFISS